MKSIDSLHLLEKQFQIVTPGEILVEIGGIT